MIESEDSGRWLIGKQPELGQPSDIVAMQRATLPCECAIYVGRRTDNGEAATVGIPCTPAHNQILALTNSMLRESLRDPSSQPLVEVVDTFMKRADEIWRRAQ